jgi:hypothetical protein
MKYKELRENIKLLALELEEGQSVTCLCPKCRGGSTGEEKLSITRTSAGLLYNCYRASCKFKGFVSSLPGSLLPEPNNKKHKKPHPFTRPLIPLPEDMVLYLMQKYNLTEKDIANNGLAYDVDYDRLYLPIYNSLGYEIGGCAKKLGFKQHGNSQGSKNIIYYNDPDIQLLHFATKASELNTIIVVEDQLSAIRVSKYGRGVALLGTNWNDTTTVTLQKETRNIILALDADTWDKAVPLPIAIARKYSLFFDTFKLVKVNKDPKDSTEEELQALFGDAMNNGT